MTVVVQNWYFIRPGQEDEALEVRRAASQVRAEAGQPVGRILLQTQPGAGIPHFIWECDYPDQPAREADAAWADASPAFSAVRERMGRLLERFERVTLVVDGT
jgi:hypothetical protein